MLVEQERVEVVRQVVVMRDHRTVALTTVQTAVDPRLRRGRAGRRADDAEPHCVADRGQPVTGPDVEPGAPVARELPHPAEAVVEVALHVEVAGHVGPGQPELARAPQQAPQGAPVAQHHHRCAGRPGLAAVPRPDPHGEVVADDAAHHPGQGLGHRGPAHGASSDSTSWATSR